MRDGAGVPGPDEPLDAEPFLLSELLDHVLDRGVVISGHVTISIADIDLLFVDLKLLLTSVQTAMDRGSGERGSVRGQRADASLLPPAGGR